MNDLTWACHICNEERPDAKISVLTKPLNIPGVISSENIRYCNDKPECVAGAQTFSFYKDKAETTTDDWLSEFEQLDHDAVVLKPGWIYKNMLLMARVLREQSAILKRDSPWSFVGGGVVGGGYECRCCQAFIRTYLSPDRIDSTDFVERHKKDCVWRNLSDDAKALLKAKREDDDRDNN